MKSGQECSGIVNVRKRSRKLGTLRLKRRRKGQLEICVDLKRI